MVRSYWKGTLVVALACPGFLWGQQPQGTPVKPIPAPSATESLITVEEAGKPAQKCRVLKCWALPDGTPARDVQDVASGEVMTIVEIGGGTPMYGPTITSTPTMTTSVPHTTPSTPPVVTSAPRATTSAPLMATSAPPKDNASTRIYHWGRRDNRPEGVPVPPPSETVTTKTSGGMLQKWFGSEKGDTTVQTTPSMTTSSSPSAEKAVQAPAKPQTVTPAEKTAQTPAKPLTLPPVEKTAQAPAKPLMLPSADKVTQAPAKPTTLPPVEKMAQAPPRPLTLPAANGHRVPPADVCMKKAGPAATDAGCSKPVAFGDSCMARPTEGTSVAEAAVAKPFHVVAGARPIGKTVAQGVEAAQPSDFRRSWGKPDAPTTSTASRPSQTPKSPEKVAASTPPAKAPDSATPAQASAPSKPTPIATTELPRANTKRPDPLQKPEEYSRRPLETAPEAKKEAVVTASVKPEVAKPEAAKPEAAKPVVVKAEVPKPEVVKAEAVKPVDPKAPGTASTQTRMPLGAASVLAAYGDHPPNVIYVPVPVVTLPGSTAPRQVVSPADPTPKAPSEEQANAFSPMNQPAGSSEAMASNAFSTTMTPTPPAYAYAPRNMMPPAMPGQMYSGPVAPNPIMQAGYRPQPGMPMPGMPMAGMPMPGMPMPGMPMPGYPSAPTPGYYPQMPAPAAAGTASTTPATSKDPQQLLLTLKDALYPSHREWAAEALAGVDWHQSPQVVDALLLGAKEDPAATVRAGCVRSLARMNIHTSAVSATLQGLKADPDPRVRQDVEQALTHLGNPVDAAPAVQPVGGIMPK